MDFTQAASALYSTADPAADAPVAQPPEPETMPAADAAGVLYGDPPTVELDIPDEIRALREADRNRLLYEPAKHFSGVINDRTVELPDDMPQAVKAAALAEVANMAADLGMSPQDVEALRVVGVACNAAPPGHEQRAAWQEEAVDRLNRQYGQGAAQAYRDAAAFAQRDPRVMAMLNEGGRGDHPDTVMIFARLARQARQAGRLK